MLILSKRLRTMQQSVADEASLTEGRDRMRSTSPIITIIYLSLIHNDCATPETVRCLPEFESCPLLIIPVWWLVAVSAVLNLSFPFWESFLKLALSLQGRQTPEAVSGPDAALSSLSPTTALQAWLRTFPATYHE